MRQPAVLNARKLRRKMTLPEVLLWQRLRGEGVGFKVRRQHPLGPYIVDFFAPAARLVIEVDGAGAHDGDGAGGRQSIRDRWLNDNGYLVLHLPAADILTNMEGALHMIIAAVESPLHHASHGPPPRSGEDYA